MSIHKMPAG